MARVRNQAKKTEDKVIEEAVLVGDDLDLDQIDAVLNGSAEDIGLEIDDADFSDVDEGELVTALAADEAKEAAYAATESELEVAEEGDADPKKTKKAAAKTASEPGGAPRAKVSAVVDDPKLFADEMVRIMGDDEIMLESDTALTKDQFREVLGGITQKKVRSKALNLMRAALTGSSLDKYTSIGMPLLAEAAAQGKSLTLEEIKAKLRSMGYKEGTVGAQSGQLMNLFPSLKLAKRDTRGVLEPNPDSVLLDVFSS